MSLKSLIVVLGPTASGKSDYGQELALRCGAEIINSDSQQFYRGLDIGTGKVLPKDQKVKHHLMDLCEVGDWMSAGKFVPLADRAIQEILEKNKKAIVLGGTGLYLRALLEGLDPLPQRDEKLRAQLKQEMEEKGSQVLYEDLQKIDPLSAAKISPNDRSRLIRYLEIHLLSGKKPSSLMTRSLEKSMRYHAEIHYLNPERSQLREKIAQRVTAMLQEGWLEEVKALLRSYPAFLNWEAKPIGYQQLLEVALGKKTIEEAKGEIILLTQRYAKRQQTFFRSMLKGMREIKYIF